MGGPRKVSPLLCDFYKTVAIYFSVPKNHLGGSLAIQITVPSPQSSVPG